MNKVNIYDKIKNILSFYKNLNWYSKLRFPYSTGSISSDSVFQLNKANGISKLSTILRSTPTYSKSNTKEKTIEEISVSYTCSIYPNESISTVYHSQSPTISDVSLAMVDEDNIFDARVLGGGVNESYLEENPDSVFIASLADIASFDGMPTQASTTVFIDIPSDIYNQYSSEYIKDIVQKYTSAGVIPIIRSY